jgi:hypothetical protein
MNLLLTMRQIRLIQSAFFIYFFLVLQKFTVWLLNVGFFFFFFFLFFDIAITWVWALRVVLTTYKYEPRGVDEIFHYSIL